MKWQKQSYLAAGLLFCIVTYAPEAHASHSEHENNDNMGKLGKTSEILASSASSTLSFGTKFHASSQQIKQSPGTQKRLVTSQTSFGITGESEEKEHGRTANALKYYHAMVNTRTSQSSERTKDIRAPNADLFTFSNMQRGNKQLNLAKATSELVGMDGNIENTGIPFVDMAQFDLKDGNLLQDNSAVITPFDEVDGVVAGVYKVSCNSKVSSSGFCVIKFAPASSGEARHITREIWILEKLQQLDLDNIVIPKFQIDDGHDVGLVTEFIDGQTLDDVLFGSEDGKVQGRMFSLPETCRLIIPLVETLVKIHHAGIAHRKRLFILYNLKCM